MWKNPIVLIWGTFQENYPEKLRNVRSPSRYCKPGHSELKAEDKIIDFLEISHLPSFIIRNKISVTELSLHPQVKAYSVSPS